MAPVERGEGLLVTHRGDQQLLVGDHHQQIIAGTGRVCDRIANVMPSRPEPGARGAVGRGAADVQNIGPMRDTARLVAASAPFAWWRHCRASASDRQCDDPGFALYASLPLLVHAKASDSTHRAIRRRGSSAMGRRLERGPVGSRAVDAANEARTRSRGGVRCPWSSAARLRPSRESIKSSGRSEAT